MVGQGSRTTKAGICVMQDIVLDCWSLDFCSRGTFALTLDSRGTTEELVSTGIEILGLEPCTECFFDDQLRTATSVSPGCVVLQRYSSSATSYSCRFFVFY